MARGTCGFSSKLLSVSVLALLGVAGCGKVSVTENAVPSSSSPGGSVGTQPTNPSTGQPTNPSTGQPGGGNPGTTNPSAGLPGGSNPGTVHPPAEAIGEPATVTANGAVLTSTRTTVYNLNSAAVGEGSWQEATLLENRNETAYNPRVAFDSTGNGFAVWTHDTDELESEGHDILVSRYIASVASWSAPLVLDSSNAKAHEPRVAVDHQSGNALAVWVQSDGTARSLYVRRFDAAANTWSASQLLENANGAVSDFESVSVSITGSQAAVAWLQADGSPINNVYLSRLVGGTWTSPALVDTGSDVSGHPEVAIDASGNAVVVWRQRDGEHRIHARRWNNSTQTFGSVIQLDNEGDRQPRLGMDAAGNAFVLWRGGGIYVRRYDATTDQWGPQVTVDSQTGDPIVGDLAVDDDGNAMAVWVQNRDAGNEVYVSRYSAAAASWGAPELMELSEAAANPDKNPAVSLSGDEAVVAWIQHISVDVERDLVYARKLSAGTWGPVTLLGSSDVRADAVTSTINAAGNAAVLLLQGESVYAANYQSSNFVVPNGATWQSLANTLYGVNSVEGGNALQAALGGGSVPAPGTILNGLPSTLSVTTAVPPYYTVLATDTWPHLTQAVYGVTDVNAIAQLRTLLGNPTLAAGLQLVVPTTFNYVTSGSYSAPLDWDRVNTTTTTYHTLDTSALTTPLDSWSAPQLLESSSAFSPQVAFDANNNGIAVWAQASDIMMSRYSASTATWSTPMALDNDPNDAGTPHLAMDRISGDAVVSWTHGDGNNVSEWMYVSTFDAGTNSWSTPTLLGNTAISPAPDGSAVAKAGEHAAVAWVQTESNENNLYLSRLVGGTWTAPALIDAGADEAQQIDVAIDANGNAAVIWRQLSAAGENRINVRRWDNVAQAYGSVTAINGDGERHPRIAFDAQGNGFALWGGGAYARRFDVTTGQWGPQVQLHGGEYVQNGEIAVDAAGNALAAWMEDDGTAYSTYARYYDVTTQTWGAAVALENSTHPVSTDRYPTVSLVDGSGVVAWLQETGEPDIYAARLANGVWGSATMLDTSADRTGDAFASAIDADNNATVVWIQGESVHHAVSNATPYYLVTAGATWRSIAATLYNVDSDAAGNALRTAMSNPTLTAGLRLQAPPATLVVTPQVPTHYIIRSGDTWASITLALYGTDRAEAAAALQAHLGNPALTIGGWLFIPSELSYSVPDED